MRRTDTQAICYPQGNYPGAGWSGRPTHTGTAFEAGDPYVFIECEQTIFPIRGASTPVTPRQVIEYEVPDMCGRPWSQMWERYTEQDMQRPVNEDIFSID